MQMPNPDYKACIVLIDDDVEMLSVLKEFLEDSGYNVMSYPLADIAHEKIILSPQRDQVLAGLDAVITDLSTPGMDGIGFLQEIKKARPSLPVILISAHGTNFQESEARKLGAYAMLSKPFRLSELNSLLADALKN